MLKGNFFLKPPLRATGIVNLSFPQMELPSLSKAKSKDDAEEVCAKVFNRPFFFFQFFYIIGSLSNSRLKFFVSRQWNFSNFYNS